MGGQRVKNTKFFSVRFLIQVLITILGTGIYALGVYAFTAPNQIAPGGVTGISTVLNYLFQVPIGLMNALINVPLIIVGYIFLGKHFILKTLISVVSFTVIYDYVLKYLPQFKGDPLLAALFGGVLIGVGLGVTFICEGSTGGLDITSKVIQKKFPHLPIGKVVFCSDLIVISIAALAFKDITTAMYAIIAMFVSSKVIDTVLYGMDLGKMVLIITAHGDEMAKRLMERMERGVTKLDSVGAYTNEQNQTLVCAVRQNEYHRLKRLVQDVDSNAFMIVTTSSEVVGFGFQNRE